MWTIFVIINENEDENKAVGQIRDFPFANWYFPISDAWRFSLNVLTSIISQRFTKENTEMVRNEKYNAQILAENINLCVCVCVSSIVDSIFISAFVHLLCLKAKQ